MIKGIWIRIVLLLSLAIVPATLLQLKLQKDSVSLVYSLFENGEITSTLDQFLGQIKDDARQNPEKESIYRARFTEVLQVKRAVESFFMMRDSIEQYLLFQTVWIILGALIVSIFGSLLISRGIVRQVKQLVAEREKANSKLRDLNALKNWQGIARTLVHELRAPITPIKLISSDLDRKFQHLSREDFAKYLLDAQRLMNEQVQAIESMMSGFTKFGRLPAPDLQSAPLTKFMDEFCTNYGEAFGQGVKITAESPAIDISVMMDQKLMRDLLFNLCKNAAEANNGHTEIKLRQLLTENSVLLEVCNTGAAVPSELREKLFDPYASSKAGSDSGNMGLGLTISKKIALDHGGDLTLVDDGQRGEVKFQIEIPRVK